jgi:hypothetical protein
VKLVPAMTESDRAAVNGWHPCRSIKPRPRYLARDLTLKSPRHVAKTVRPSTTFSGCNRRVSQVAAEAA